MGVLPGLDQILDQRVETETILYLAPLRQQVAVQVAELIQTARQIPEVLGVALGIKILCQVVLVLRGIHQAPHHLRVITAVLIVQMDQVMALEVVGAVLERLEGMPLAVPQGTAVMVVKAHRLLQVLVVLAPEDRLLLVIFPAVVGAVATPEDQNQVERVARAVVVRGRLEQLQRLEPLILEAAAVVEVITVA